MNLCMPDAIEEKIEVANSGSTTLNSSIQLGAGMIVNFGQPLINSYDEYNADFLSNHGVLQEILPKEMSEKQKKDKIIGYLSEIEASDSRLIIVDPYLFSEKYDEKYPDLIIEILRKSGAKEIVVITDTHNEDYRKELCGNVNKKVGGIIKVKHSKIIHDRFWITDKNKGFSLGTSLNGVGKKVTRIDELEEDEVKVIMEKLRKYKLL